MPCGACKKRKEAMERLQKARQAANPQPKPRVNPVPPKPEVFKK